jgi:hypothetical protein
VAAGVQPRGWAATPERKQSLGSKQVSRVRLLAPKTQSDDAEEHQHRQRKEWWSAISLGQSDDAEEHHHQQRKEPTAREPMRRMARSTTAAAATRSTAAAAVEGRGGEMRGAREIQMRFCGEEGNSAGKEARAGPTCQRGEGGGNKCCGCFGRWEGLAGLRV